MSISSKVLRRLRKTSPHYDAATKTFTDKGPALPSYCKHCKSTGSDPRHHRGLCRRLMRKVTGKNKK